MMSKGRENLARGQATLELLLWITMSTVCALAAMLPCSGCSGDRDGTVVVVYTSVDEMFARPVLERFEAETGIKVDAMFDVEANKTTGLFHRLRIEHSTGRPRADVFWNSEVARTVQLAELGVFSEYRAPTAAGIPDAFKGSQGAWTGFAARARVIVYNPARVPRQEAPRSIGDLMHERWRGRAGIALPLFGTTATHAGALWAHLGAVQAEEYFRGLLANDVRVLAGNSVVRDRVVSGELDVGLTDTDDAFVALSKGQALGIVFPDQEPGFPGVNTPLGTFVIPNTVGLVQRGPSPSAGKMFVDYLLSAKTEAALARSESAQIPLRPGIEPPKIPDMPTDLRWMEVDYVEVARGVAAAREVLEKLFVR